MSGQFNGFTSADIKKVATSIKTNKENAQSKSTLVKKRIPNQQIVQSKKPEPIVCVEQREVETDSSISSLQNAFMEAMEFKPPSERMENDTEEILTTTTHNTVDKKVVESDMNQDSNGNSNVDIRPERRMPLQGMSLRDYEAQNRIVKEQNRMKKEMLCKAIEQHSERTAAEVKKLKDIQLELSRMESELTADVSVLRKQIELASIRYMNANKHYLQVETAFLKAKLDLHEAQEKKEMLAEHLNIIISNNEIRKAKKLAELMEKVGLTEEIIDNDQQNVADNNN